MTRLLLLALSLSAAAACVDPPTLHPEVIVDASLDLARVRADFAVWEPYAAPRSFVTMPHDAAFDAARAWDGEDTAYVLSGCPFAMLPGGAVFGFGASVRVACLTPGSEAFLPHEIGHLYGLPDNTTPPSLMTTGLPQMADGRPTARDVQDLEGM